MAGVILGAAVQAFDEGATRRGSTPRAAIDATEQILWGDPDNPTAKPFRRFGAHRLYFLWVAFRNFASNLDVADDIAKNRMPVINIRPVRGESPGMVYYADIYNGLVDADIDDWATAIKSYAPNILGVTFDAEPWDGIGNPSINPLKHGNTTEFCRAFKYIVDRFKGPVNNVTNVKWCNNLTSYDYTKVSTQAGPLWGVGTPYALDTVVDYVGADGYQWYPCRPDQTPSWTEFEEIFNATRQFALTLRGGTGMPIWVLETGCQENDGFDQFKGGYPGGPGGYWCPERTTGLPVQPTRKAAWFTNMQTALRDEPKWAPVEMVCYFDERSETVNAWWLDSRESSRSAFEEVGRDPYFNGGSVTEPPPTGPPGIFYQTGFEHGSYSIVGNLFGVGSAGTPSVQGTTKLHGNYALELNPAGAAEAAVIDFEFAQEFVIGTIAFRLAAPGVVGGNADILTVFSDASAVDAKFRIRASDGKINAAWTGGTVEDGPVITTNVWHLLEFRVNFNSRAINWRVDRAAQNTVPSTGAATDVAFGIALGTGQGTVTYTMQMDDLVLSNVKADYPLGDVEVIGLKPNEILSLGGSSQGIPPATGTQWPGSLNESPPSFVGLPNRTPDDTVPEVTNWAGAPDEIGASGTGTEEEFRVRWVMRKAGTSRVFIAGGFTGVGIEQKGINVKLGAHPSAFRWRVPEDTTTATGPIRRASNEPDSMTALEEELWGNPRQRRFDEHRLFYTRGDTGTFPDNRALDTADANRTPSCHWRLANTSAGQTKTWRSIANGGDDAKLDELATAIVNWDPTKLPPELHMDFDWEMYAFSQEKFDADGNTRNGDPPWGDKEDFKDMFRHIVTYMKAKIASLGGAPMKVTFSPGWMADDFDRVVQQSAVPAGEIAYLDWDAWWPGDEYCDYLGVDTYNWAPSRSGPYRSFDNIADAAYRRARQHGKKVHIGETAAQEADGWDARLRGTDFNPRTGGFWPNQNGVDPPTLPTNVTPAQASTEKERWINKMSSVLRRTRAEGDATQPAAGWHVNGEDTYAVNWYDRIPERPSLDADHGLDSRPASTAAYAAMGLLPEFNGGATTLGDTRMHIAQIDITEGDSVVVGSFNPTVAYGPATSQGFLDDPSQMIQGMAIDSTGDYIYITGNFEFVNGVARNGLAKIKISDGSLDTGWAPEIFGSGYSVCTFGTIVYVSGSFTSVKPSAVGALVTRNRIAAFDGTTGAVQTFNPNVNGTVRMMRINPAGDRLAVVGNFSHLGAAAPSGFDRNMIAVINTANGNATNFEPTWPTSTPQVCYSMCLSPSGEFMYVGVDGTASLGGNRVRKFKITNPTAAGIPDPELWNSLLPGDSGNIQGIAATDNYVFAGHHGNGDATGHGKKLYVCNASDGVILNWDSNPKMDSTFSGVFQLAATTNALIVGGSMWSEKPRRGFAVYRASSGTTPTANFTREDGTTPVVLGDWDRLDDWPPGADGISQAIAVGDDFIQMGFEPISPAEVAPLIYGVSAVHAFHSAAGGGANVGGARIKDGAHVTDLFTPADMGDVGTTKTYRNVMVESEAGATWSKPKIAGLIANFGFSTDAVPRPIWDSFLLEVSISRGGRTPGSTGNAYAETSGLGIARSTTKGVTDAPQVITSGVGVGHKLVVDPPPPTPSSFVRPARRHYGLGTIVHSFIGRAGATVTLQLDDWQAEESVNAGYGAASGVIPARFVERNADVFKDGAKWFSYVAEEGEIIWAGRLLPVNIVSGAAQLKGKGVAEIANTKFDRYLLQNRFYGDWTSMESEPHNYQAGDSYDFSVNGGALTWKMQNGSEFKPNGQDGAVFWGTGVDITRLKFRLQKQGNDSHFKLKLEKATGPSGGRTNVQTWSLASGGPTGPIELNIPGSQDQLILSVIMDDPNQYTIPAGATVRVDVTGVIVNGLAKGDEFSASQVVRTVTDRLNVSPILISPLGTNVMPMDFTDGSHGEVLDYVCLLTDSRYRFIDLGAAGIACDFGPWDKRVWQSVRNEQPVDLVPLERFNKIRVPYRRNSGGTGNITVTTTSPDMEYENEFTDVGLDQPFGDDGVAKGFGQKVLEYLVTSRYGGSALLAEVIDEVGGVHTAHHIHAGDSFRLQNGIVLRITNVSRTAAGVRITFDEELAALNTLNAKRTQRLALRGREG